MVFNKIGSNKRLFSFLQDKILEMRMNFKKPSLEESSIVVQKQENKIDLLMSCVRFLIVMVQGNSDLNNLVHVLNHI